MTIVSKLFRSEDATHIKFQSFILLKAKKVPIRECYVNVDYLVGIDYDHCVKLFYSGDARRI